PIDGFQNGSRIKFPDVFTNLFKVLCLLPDDADMFVDALTGMFEKKIFAVDGKIYIKDPVVQRELCSNIFTVASNFYVPGLKPDHDNVFAFQHRVQFRKWLGAHDNLINESKIITIHQFFSWPYL